MPLDVSEMETLRDELIKARSRGIRSVMYDGKRTEYSTDTEMAAAIADLERRIASARNSRPRTIGFSSSKGI